jgi:peroxiredoxin
MKSLEGQKAPAFSLEGDDGKTHSLEDYRVKRSSCSFIPRTVHRAEPRKLAGSAS